MKSIIVLCFLGFVALTFATNGCDFSGAISEGSNSNDLDCLHKDGEDFIIIQTWMGGYGYTSNIADSTKWAWDAGFSHVDVYIFMCPNCAGNGNAATVVDTVFNNLENQGVKYGMIWFDVEQCSGCWSSESANCGYIGTAVNEAVKLGAKPGLYSSVYEWSITVGDGCKSFSNYPLWYAHYDGEENYDDTSDWDFGGWKAPSMKQYTDTGPCISVDSDWYPDKSDWYKNYTSSTPPLVDTTKYAAQFAAYEQFKQTLINGSSPNVVPNQLTMRARSAMSKKQPYRPITK